MNFSLLGFHFVGIFPFSVAGQVNDHHLKVHAVEKVIQQLIRSHHRLRKVVKFPHHPGIYTHIYTYS